MSHTYYNCYRLTNCYIYSKVISNMYRAFNGISNIAIYTYPNTNTSNKLFYSNTYGLSYINFINETNHSYNTLFNIHLYFTL